MALAERLAEHVRACFTGLWIESHEHDDAIVEISQLCRQESWHLAVWDIDRGLRVAAQEARVDSSSADPLAALRRYRHCHRRTGRRFSCWLTSIAF